MRTGGTNKGRPVACCNITVITFDSTFALFPLMSLTELLLIRLGLCHCVCA